MKPEIAAILQANLSPADVAELLYGLTGKLAKEGMGAEAPDWNYEVVGAIEAAADAAEVLSMEEERAADERAFHDAEERRQESEEMDRKEMRP